MPSKQSGKGNGRYSTGLTMKDDPKRGLYISWQNMKQRCLNKNHPKYHRYGGRGVSLHESWRTIEGFLAWAENNGWVSGKTIDRINNDGNYEPSNCHFVSPEENSRKKSTTKISRSQADSIRERLEAGENEYLIADEFGVVHGTIWFIKNRYTHVDDGECSKKLKSTKKPNQP